MKLILTISAIAALASAFAVPGACDDGQRPEPGRSPSPAAVPSNVCAGTLFITVEIRRHDNVEKLGELDLYSDGTVACAAVEATGDSGDIVATTVTIRRCKSHQLGDACELDASTVASAQSSDSRRGSNAGPVRVRAESCVAAFASVELRRDRKGSASTGTLPDGRYVTSLC